MLGSTVFFSVMNALVKYLDYYHVFQLVFFRALGTLFITFIMLKRRKIHLWGNQKRLLILRGLVGTTSMFLFFLGIHYMTMGSAVTLRYLAPLFVGIISILMYKKSMLPRQWFYFGLAFLGVYFIKGFDPTADIFGIIVVLLSAVFSAGVYLIISKIGTKDHPLVVVFYFMLIATIFGGIGSLFFGVDFRQEDLFLMLLLGVFGFFGQILMTQAFQKGPAVQIAPFKYIEVVFTLSIGILLFSETYHLLHLIGTFLIILGLVLNMRLVAHLDER
tara:strand:- start:308 stop:1129 length:822 start_codon:yes stop_codon:yes gene_type:complete